MKSLDFGCYVLTSCVAVAMLAGCGGSQPPIGAPLTVAKGSQSREILKPSSLTPTYKVSGPLLYVANVGLNVTPLTIYNANADNPKPIATISKDIDNSLGACMDGDGTLYVTNYPNSGTGWVSEYALGRTKLLRVITKGIGEPAFCTIDASGNLWVTNPALDDVAQYLKGSKTPHATITKGLVYPTGIAIDHAGNLYVANFEPYGTSNIQVYAPGSKSPSRTITEGVTSPLGIAVDAHDTLYVTTNYLPSSIEEYRAGQSKPYRTITDKLSYPAGVVVGKNGWLYVANDGQYSDEMAVLEFPPHSVKPSSREITKELFHPHGVAYYPPLLP
jgi:DNA-binding beta-propeller fold protein YncE